MAVAAAIGAITLLVSIQVLDGYEPFVCNDDASYRSAREYEESRWCSLR